MAAIPSIILARPDQARHEGTIIAKDKGWYEKSADLDSDTLLVEFDQNGGFVTWLTSHGFTVTDGVVTGTYTA